MANQDDNGDNRDSAKRRRNTKRQSDLMPASKVLQTLLGNGKSALSDPFLRWRLWRFWSQVVGPGMGNDCEPVGYQRGRLYIWVKSSSRMQEIRFFEDDLKIKINKYLGMNWVRSIRFTMDRKGVPSDATQSENMKDFIDSQD